MATGLENKEAGVKRSHTNCLLCQTDVLRNAASYIQFTGGNGTESADSHHGLYLLIGKMVADIKYVAI